MNENARYFRAGVGTVIYNSEGNVAWFERNYHPKGVWQFQQGGIDSGESIEQTLWRELEEEVGLTQDDIGSTTEYPHWTIYVYPYKNLSQSEAVLQDRLGQAHRWFFLKLKDDAIINLTNATEDEFIKHSWTTFDDVLKKTQSEKKHVYEDLYTFYKML